MSVKTIGIALLGIGVAIFFGGGGLPVNGFSQSFNLYKEYQIAIRDKKEPSIDQKGSYYTYLFYFFGFSLISLGAVLILISYVVGE